jgi:acetyl-CoA acyltransferase
MIDDVIWGGTALMKDMGSNIGRYAGIMAGLPYSVPGCTVDRFCSSGLQSIAFAVASINMGWAELILAGGVQHMTHIPMGTMSDPNPRLKDFCDPQMISMGYTAEMVARRYGITRQEQDEMAVESHAKAHEATQKGLFKDEILPIEADVPREDGTTQKMIVDRDQGIRPGTTLETLAKLEPVFIKAAIQANPPMPPLAWWAQAKKYAKNSASRRRCGWWNSPWSVSTRPTWASGRPSPSPRCSSKPR